MLGGQESRLEALNQSAQSGGYQQLFHANCRLSTFPSVRTKVNKRGHRSHLFLPPTVLRHAESNRTVLAVNTEINIGFPPASDLKDEVNKSICGG